jgi:osmotically-inducible protein OsmY
MDTFKKISTFMMVLSMMFMVGCASADNKESAGEFIDDTVITTKVKAALLDEVGLKSSEINVETFKGVVQLSGFVASQERINKAIEVTRAVKGVKSIKNNMLIK